MTLGELRDKVQRAIEMTHEDEPIEFARGGHLPDGAGEFHSIDEMVIVAGLELDGQERVHPTRVYLVQT
jgi:hypothetical protein